jgi:outer membrane protein TolC
MASLLRKIRFVVLATSIQSSSLLFTETSFAAPSAVERQWLASLPGGKLELAVLLSAAKRLSGTYQGIQSIQKSAEASELRASAPYRPLLSAKLQKTDNQLEPASPFEPGRIESTTIGLGLEQAFLTGTAISFDSKFGPTALGFSSQSSNPSSVSYQESRFDFMVNQSLWRDSFGASSRLRYKTGVLGAEVLRQQRRAELEAYALVLVGEFYEAWMAQNRVRDAAETLARKTRIEKMTRVRAARGTAERPDILEAEAAKVSAEMELRAARELLLERWLKLAAAIKLDLALAAQVDPIEVPLVLDSLDPSVSALCLQAGTNSGSAALAHALASQKRAETEAERAELERKPDLKLRGRLSTNGIDSRWSESASEAIRGKHLGWEVSLNFVLPLGQYEAEALRQEARSQELRASAHAQASIDEERVRWEIRCKEIARREKDLRHLRENAERQNERGRLEEARFSIGRIRLNDVTRAEDEALLSNVRLRLEEISLRRALWSIRELNGQIPETLEALP